MGSAMASFVQPDASASSGYRGLAEVFEFTNWDGVHRRANCGQAACATFVAFHRFLESDRLRAVRLMDELEARFPPDILGGLLGTSRRRVEQVCRAFGLSLQTVE